MLTDDPKINAAVFAAESRLAQQINTKYDVLHNRLKEVEDAIDGDGKADIGLKAKVESIQTAQTTQSISQRWQGYILVAIFVIELLGFGLLFWLYALSLVR